MPIEKVEILKIDQATEIDKIIEENYGCTISLEEKYTLFKTSSKKVWVCSKSVSEVGVDVEYLRPPYMGLCLGKLKRNNKISLTTEGAQIVGKQATKNIVMLDRENAMLYVQGFDVKVDQMINCEQGNFVIIKYQNDVLGSSRIYDQNKIENMVSKIRKVVLGSLE